MARSNKDFSNKQEAMIAKELGGHKIGGSGAAPCAPGDVRTDTWLIECKTHTTPDHSIYFDLEVWQKISKEAMGTHRKPVLIVDDGSQTLEKTWCLCRANNLNLGHTMTTEFPVTIRKNVTCRHDKLMSKLKLQSKGFVFPNGFYTNAGYKVNWNNEEIVILPFEAFKELFED